MKKILILTSLYSNDYDNLVKEISEAFSKKGVVLNSKMLLPKKELAIGQETIKMLATYKKSKDLIELGLKYRPDAEYVIYIGPCGVDVSFDSVYSYKGLALDVQEEYLIQNYPKIKKVITKEIYNHSHVVENFPMIIMLKEKLQKEIDEDGFKQIQ